jgi:L-2-hydroxyglutarate oxidase
LDSCDVVVVGAGIVGLSTAMALTAAAPGLRVLIVEKEAGIAEHQTGRNSGVIHSGAYYRPGSAKARYATEGSRRLYDFCRDHAVPADRCGKLIVATEDSERDRLAEIERRAVANGIVTRRLSPAEIRDREPQVRALAGLLVPITGITDYRAVAAAYLQVAQAGGAVLRAGVTVTGIRSEAGAITVDLDGVPAVRARVLVNCAGLFSDRIAELAGLSAPARILPFRGEYFELVPERRDLVRDLIYPVPDPAFPFLGVHFTRGIDGSVHAGPNAVLALRREGYSPWSFRPADAAGMAAYPGFWRLARQHWRTGTGEYRRSLSKQAFVRSLQRLIPAVRAQDLVPAPAGVRAQAVLPSGALVDDFLIVEGPQSVHVLNAPSPAATASIPIGESVAARALEQCRDWRSTNTASDGT